MFIKEIIGDVNNYGALCLHTQQTFSYSEQASERPVGPFGANPARDSAFIGLSILMDTEALEGFAMPARVLAFIGVSILTDTEALKGFAMPARISAFNSV